MDGYRLALDTGHEVIKIGDSIAVRLKGEDEPFICTLIGVFTSVHPPYEVRLQLSNRPYHMSIGADDITSISNAGQPVKGGGEA